jgi:hypothetical protein
MNKKPDIQEKIEQAMNSLDGLQRATPEPWFFTRVKGRMLKEEKTPWIILSALLARPAVSFVSLMVVLLLNGFFLFQQEKKTISNPIVSQPEQAIATDNEYIIASSSTFEYEKLTQP